MAPKPPQIVNISIQNLNEFDSNNYQEYPELIEVPNQFLIKNSSLTDQDRKNINSVINEYPEMTQVFETFGK